LKLNAFAVLLFFRRGRGVQLVCKLCSREFPPSSPDKWAEALQAIERLETKTSKLRERIERREEEFFSEATKAAGKQAGTWLAGTFVIWLVGQMLVFRSLLTRGWRLCRNSR